MKIILLSKPNPMVEYARLCSKPLKNDSLLMYVLRIELGKVAQYFIEIRCSIIFLRVFMANSCHFLKAVLSKQF